MANKYYHSICPCYGCNDRHATCHSTCSKYVGWTNDATYVETHSFSQGLVDHIRKTRHRYNKWRGQG